MALSNDQLFLERFIEYNKERYSDEPNFVAALDSLTLASVNFSNYRKSVDQASSKITYLVDMVSQGLFVANDQQYNPADYMAEIVSNKVEQDPLPIESIKQKEVEGLYLVDNTPGEVTGVLLLKQGNNTLVSIQGIVKTACNYELLDNEITVNEDFTKVTVDSRTIASSFDIVRSTATQSYDGSLTHDGSLTY